MANPSDVGDFVDLANVNADERYFFYALNDRLADAGLRLLFADWLNERGDWRTEGYFWMANHRKEPSKAYRSFDWWHEDSRCRREIVLPPALWEALPVAPHISFSHAKEFLTLRAADNAVCRLIAGESDSLV